MAIKLANFSAATRILFRLPQIIDFTAHKSLGGLLVVVVVFRGFSFQPSSSLGKANRKHNRQLSPMEDTQIYLASRLFRQPHTKTLTKVTKITTTKNKATSLYVYCCCCCCCCCSLYCLSFTFAITPGEYSFASIIIVMVFVKTMIMSTGQTSTSETT